MVGRNSSIVKRYQRKFRERRFSKVLQIIERQLEGKEQLRILDAGGLVGYWRMLPEHLRDRVRITIINRDHIVEDDRSVDADGLNIELCAGDACDMPQYADGSFDIVHSNSVIEHVGGYRQMMQFSAEVRRVGVAYYVQTPNFWFPIDPHNGMPFLHWLPDPLRAALASRFTMGMHKKLDYSEVLLARIQHCRMISFRMLREFFPDADFTKEKFLLLFNKSLIASRGGGK